MKSVISMLAVALLGSVLHGQPAQDSINSSAAVHGTAEDVRSQLEEMARTDQAIRQKIFTDENTKNTDSASSDKLWEEQRIIDNNNISLLREIYTTTGWPKVSEVGEEAAMGAFLVVQHADKDVQEEFLPVLRKAADTGDVKKSLLALLEDRVLVRKGQPQLYGSQLRRDPQTGVLRFFPIRDAENVNSRRADMGLGPIEEYAKKFGIVYVPGQWATVQIEKEQVP